MSIKLIDPKAQFEVICSQDDALLNETPEELEALNGEKTRFQKYMKSLNQ